MKTSGNLRAALIAAILVAATSAQAQTQDAGDGTLHVLRPVIHAEQESAEICLEFDHELDAADRGHLASLIRLESGGKSIPVRAQTMSVTGNLLCVPSLEHRKDYRIVINGARGSKGEKLANPYGFSFTVPDRAPSLSFTGNTGGEGMVRWRDEDPILRALNVPYVRLELYRVTDADAMSAAWRDRQQTVLAPSESATFGHDHGKLVWSGDLTLAAELNKSFERNIPLADNAPNAPNGLYLIVARGPEVKSEISEETDEATGTKTAPLAPVAALWLLRSGLHLQALRDTTGFYGVAVKAGAPPEAPLKNTRLVAEDANASVLAETRSDDEGIGFIALDAGKISNTAALAGFTDAGDVNFVDASAASVTRFTPPKDEITLAADKSFYPPATQASVTLVAHDAEGRALAEGGTTLALLGADGSAYEELPVPALANGQAQMSFPVPAQEGVWPLAWRQGDRVLAQSSLRVTADPAAPRIEMISDRQAIAHDGALNLTLKSLTATGAPAPYAAGQVFVAWGSPDTLSEWKDYHFGAGWHDAGDAAALTSFVTDEKGVAALHLTLTPPDDRAALHSALLSLRGDASAGVAMPAPLAVPMKPKEGVVGVKPLAPDARFPENGVARFSVVALDADGHRRAEDDLDYQVYEEGRSFDWYQADGRWEYKLQQQKRRIGGGALTLAADGDDIIEWPVAAGIYRIEITDANGAVRAAADFSAGSGAPSESNTPAPLALASSLASWRPGQAIEAHFTLEKPSMATAFVGDDHIRKVIHRMMSAGDNAVSFDPGKDWNGPLSLTVDIETPPAEGHRVFARAADKSTPVKAETKAAPADTLAIDATPPALLHVGDTTRLALEVANNGAALETLHYALSATELRADNASGTVAIPVGQTRRISVTVTALRAGSASIKLDMTGAAHLHASREWTIPVVADISSLGPGVRQRIEPQQSTSWPPAATGAAKAHAREDSLLFLSPASLYGAPAFLADLLAAEPFTTGEIAATLEALRLWRGPIIDADLMPEAALDLRQRELLSRLIARQRPDGGFAALPGARPASDENFAMTARALVALAAGDLAAAKPAADRAAQWLQQRLSNTWFDESERPVRAEAYAALAAADRLDNASLHYFSDTSAKTTVPMEAALDLAFAFAQIGDQPASAFWIETSDVKKNLPEISSALFPILAGNAFFDVSLLQSSLETFSAQAAKNADTKSIADFLRAVSVIQSRKGSWRVTIGTDKRNPKGVLVASVPSKTAAPVINNTGDNPVFLFGTQRATAKPAAAAARHIYRLNGTEMDAAHPLAAGETYLVVIEGAWPGAAESVLAHDDPAAALRVAGCLPPGPIEADDQLAWLKSQVLTAVTACDSGAGGIDMLLARKENENPASWRAAYLAKAEAAGMFALSPATAYAVTTSHAGTGLLPLARTPEQRVEIR